VKGRTAWFISMTRILANQDIEVSHIIQQVVSSCARRHTNLRKKDDASKILSFDIQLSVVSGNVFE
jgi:hypothetical protein